MKDADSFVTLLQRSLDKQAAKQAKNRRAMAAAVAEVQARNRAKELDRQERNRLMALGLDVDPNEDRAGIPWSGRG